MATENTWQLEGEEEALGGAIILTKLQTGRRQEERWQWQYGHCGQGSLRGSVVNATSGHREIGKKILVTAPWRLYVTDQHRNTTKVSIRPCCTQQKCQNWWSRIVLHRSFSAVILILQKTHTGKYSHYLLLEKRHLKFLFLYLLTSSLMPIIKLWNALKIKEILTGTNTAHFYQF